MVANTITISKAGVSIGRSSDNDIVINDPLVSRHHCRLTFDDNGNMRLTDLNSVNGVYVNGTRISNEVSLKRTDIVKIGNTILPLQNFQPIPASPPVPQNGTGIEIKTKFFPLAFLWLFCSPKIEFNGQKFRSPWGKRFFKLPAGEYNVSIYIPYLFWRRCGENSINVKVIAGQTAKISFYAPLIVFSKGSIKTI